MKIFSTSSRKIENLRISKTETYWVHHSTDGSTSVSHTGKDPMSCVCLKGLWLQSVWFAKGMLAFVNPLLQLWQSLIMKQRQCLKSLEKLLRPINNCFVFLFCAMCLCMCMCVSWEYGRREEVLFLKIIFKPKANEEFKTL